MITGAVKNKVDKIWTDLWAGGITNPLTVIEQLTYLMFIRSLDEKELETEELENMSGEKLSKIFPQSPAGQAMRWSRFKNNDAREIYEVISQRVFPAIKNMKNGHLPDFDEKGEMIEVQEESGEQQESTAFARYMSDAMFLIPTPQVLQKIITGLDDLYEHDLTGLDVQGDLYEYMLGKLATAGQNGQFRTPKQIREMMVELIAPTPDDVICDPSCGTAGFLVSASEYIRKHYEDTMTAEQWEHFATDAFSGFDMKSDGFSLDDKRSPVEQNDIPDIIRRFRSIGQTPPVTKGDIPLREGDNADDILNEEGRARTEQSFFVPKQEIADNGYDLSINKYKKVEYVPVEYPSTTEIMADLHELEMEITAGLAELEEML